VCQGHLQPAELLVLLVGVVCKAGEMKYKHMNEFLCLPVTTTSDPMSCQHGVVFLASPVNMVASDLREDGDDDSLAGDSANFPDRRTKPEEGTNVMFPTALSTGCISPPVETGIPASSASERSR
jgi:hypothetical protein